MVYMWILKAYMQWSKLYLGCFDLMVLLCYYVSLPLELPSASDFSLGWCTQLLVHIMMCPLAHKSCRFCSTML